MDYWPQSVIIKLTYSFVDCSANVMDTSVIIITVIACIKGEVQELVLHFCINNQHYKSVMVVKHVLFFSG